jgi:hypothetical protein
MSRGLVAVLILCPAAEFSTEFQTLCEHQVLSTTQEQGVGCIRIVLDKLTVYLGM